jgi:hypothetical protein
MSSVFIYVKSCTGSIICVTCTIVNLTFKHPRWYLNFSLWFVKNANIIWTEKDRILTSSILWTMNWMELMQHVFKISVLCKCIKLISRGGVLHVFMYTNIGHLKVQTVLHGSRQCSGRCCHCLLQVGEYIFFSVL